MALTLAQQAEVWQVLKDSPLIRKWPGFRSHVLPRLELQSYVPGQFIFRPGDRPLHLFIVARGRVLMRLRDSDESWFEQEIRPGGFFGQQALFDEVYRTVTRVPGGAEAAVLLSVGAEDLRIALEQQPDLREELLREGLAGRLRRIPLFRSLSDDQVKWLAHLVDERKLPAGASLDVATQPGIWVIEWGQVAIKGPAHPYPSDGWEWWRLTGGNFFIARGDPQYTEHVMRFGLNCSVDSAVARLDSHLLYVPPEDADRFITSFPDIGSLVHQPLDIVDTLGQVDALRNLSATKKRHLAQFFRWEFVPERQNITTQGTPGHSLILLREGAGLITAFDNYGRERPRSALPAGSSYGKTSFFEGKQRDATVRAVRGEGSRGSPGLPGADVLALDRRDFQHAIAERPDLWDGEELAQGVRVAEEKRPQFPWINEGEVVRWEGRPHILWLIWPLALLGLSLLMFAVLALVVASRAVDLALFLVAALILLPIGIGLVINYYDDYYVVTNRRVTRRDRQLLLFESRSEAPVEMIQDITIDAGFWGKLFGFGHVSIQTASKTAAIRLDNVPHPDEVRAHLETARAEAQAEERGRQKEELRRGLISDLKLTLPVPPRQRALGDAPLPGESDRPPLLKRVFSRSGQETVPRPTGLFRKSSQSAQPRELPGMIVWHKHWLNAVGRAGPPFMLLLVLLIVAALILADAIAFPSLNWVALAGAWLVFFLFAVAWFAWEWVDYRNDIYIVTDDMIIDIEMQPLGLSIKQREGSLERVQNVVAQQDGIWAAIFKYGDVVISTAAANEGFTFIMVPNPKRVQATIFEKLAAYRARAQKRERHRRQQELVEALTLYHQLRGGSTTNAPDGFGDRL